MLASLILLGLMLNSSSALLLNDTYGGLRTSYHPLKQVGTWNTSGQTPLYYDAELEESTNVSNTSLATVARNTDALSSRMSLGVIGGIKFLIYLARLVGEYLRRFGAELRVAKCLLMYTFTFQTISSKMSSGSIIGLLTNYFGDEDARDLYGFLSRNVLSYFGLKPDA